MLGLPIKKDFRNEVQNYRPLQILSNLSEVYEKCLFNEIATHFDDILAKYQCGFKKGFSFQQFLIMLVKKWKKIRDKTGLSKAFDLLSHDLLIAKLHAYGFDIASLKLIFHYLCERKQRVNINDKYSLWEEILFGVHQGSTRAVTFQYFCIPPSSIHK